MLVSTNKNENVWALDTNGRPHVLVNGDWRLLSPQILTSLATGASGVWGVADNGQVLYRQGVTKQIPQGLSWANVDGSDIVKISIGPNDEILGIKRDGTLVWRSGITPKYPTGASWVDLGKRVMDASLGNYGMWIIDKSGNLQFGSGGFDARSNSFNFVWSPVSGKLKKVIAGHGGSLWGVLVDGTLVKRRDVTSLQPTGTRWNVVDNFAVNDVSPGVLYVYRILSDGTLLKQSGEIRSSHF